MGRNLEGLSKDGDKTGKGHFYSESFLIAHLSNIEHILYLTVHVNSTVIVPLIIS